MTAIDGTHRRGREALFRLHPLPAPRGNERNERNERDGPCSVVEPPQALPADTGGELATKAVATPRLSVGLARRRQASTPHARDRNRCRLRLLPVYVLAVSSCSEQHKWLDIISTRCRRNRLRQVSVSSPLLFLPRSNPAPASEYALAAFLFRLACPLVDNTGRS